MVYLNQAIFTSSRFMLPEHSKWIRPEYWNEEKLIFRNFIYIYTYNFFIFVV